MSDPETPAEWQEAVDAAEGLLLIDSARQYGLITGGPKIDVERCQEILRRGREHGVYPADAATAAWMLVKKITARARRAMK